MKFIIESGSLTDIDELEKLYDELNDHLSATTNYPGWIKGIYPVRENAVAGVNNQSLFVARCGGRIPGSVILDHQPEEAYENIRWKVEADYSRIFVVRTFVVPANGSWSGIDGFFTGTGCKFRNEIHPAGRL